MSSVATQGDAATTAELQRKLLQERMKPDERAMSVGLLNVMLTAFVVGRWPQNFWLLHLFKTSVLLPWRYVRFRRHGWQFYLVDFCYFVSYYTLISCVLALLRTQFGIITPLAQYNHALFRAGFAFASGPLCWSIFIFRNAIVLHDIDQLTSVFIHLSPALLFWCWRWGGGVGVEASAESWPGMVEICLDDPVAAGSADACVGVDMAAAIASPQPGLSLIAAVGNLRVWWQQHAQMLWCGSCTATAWDLIWFPQLLYICGWAIPYYVCVFVLAAPYIKRTKAVTLFAHTMQTNPTLRSIIECAPQSLQGVVYILIHQLSTLLFSSLALIWWHSFFLHTLFLLTMIFLSCHNGATYTFRIFLARYEKNLLQRHPSVKRIAVKAGGKAQ